MEACGLNEGDEVTPAILIELSDKYLDNIFEIYEGNNIEHTTLRKENVEKGIEIYLKRHDLG